MTDVAKPKAEPPAKRPPPTPPAQEAKVQRPNPGGRATTAQIPESSAKPTPKPPARRPNPGGSIKHGAEPPGSRRKK